MTTLGSRLRELRIERSLSQEAVAHTLGMHQVTVSGWERGVRRIGVDEVVALLELYEVPDAEWPQLLRLPTIDDAAYVSGLDAKEVPVAS